MNGVCVFLSGVHCQIARTTLATKFLKYRGPEGAVCYYSNDVGRQEARGERDSKRHTLTHLRVARSIQPQPGCLTIHIVRVLSRFAMATARYPSTQNIVSSAETSGFGSSHPEAWVCPS
eukprot:COSAG02_NODE_9220_length_2285_cov_2.246569_2_plen_119_part_00